MKSIFSRSAHTIRHLYLQGHVQRLGATPKENHETMKLTDLIASYKELLPEPAAHYGDIIRT